jgi:hypothetical protein
MPKDARQSQFTDLTPPKASDLNKEYDARISVLKTLNKDNIFEGAELDGVKIDNGDLTRYRVKLKPQLSLASSDVQTITATTFTEITGTTLSLTLPCRMMVLFALCAGIDPPNSANFFVAIKDKTNSTTTVTATLRGLMRGSGVFARSSGTNKKTRSTQLFPSIVPVAAGLSSYCLVAKTASGTATVRNTSRLLAVPLFAARI